MKKIGLIILATASLSSLALLQSLNAKESNQDDSKSVAWYVSNIPEARKQNQLCHDNPQLQSSQNCANSLHALQISFNGGN